MKMKQYFCAYCEEEIEGKVYFMRKIRKYVCDSDDCLERGWEEEGVKSSR